MSASPADAGALSSGLRVLAVTLAARGDLAGARLCRNAATELTLRIGEQALALERARRERAERELLEAAGACARRWTRSATSPSASDAAGTNDVPGTADHRAQAPEDGEVEKKTSRKQVA